MDERDINEALDKLFPESQETDKLQPVGKPFLVSYDSCARLNNLLKPHSGSFKLFVKLPCSKSPVRVTSVEPSDKERGYIKAVCHTIEYGTLIEHINVAIGFSFFFY